MGSFYILYNCNDYFSLPRCSIFTKCPSTVCPMILNVSRTEKSSHIMYVYHATKYNASHYFLNTKCSLKYDQWYKMFPTLLPPISKCPRKLSHDSKCLLMKLNVLQHYISVQYVSWQNVTKCTWSAGERVVQTPPASLPGRKLPRTSDTPEMVFLNF